MNVLSFRNKAKNSKTALYFGAPEAEAESLPTSRVALSDVYEEALLHKDLKCKAPLIEPNLRRNLGKWST